MIKERFSEKYFQLLLIAAVITVVCSVLGIVFGVDLSLKIHYFSESDSFHYYTTLNIIFGSCCTVFSVASAVACVLCFLYGRKSAWALRAASVFTALVVFFAACSATSGEISPVPFIFVASLAFIANLLYGLNTALYNSLWIAAVDRGGARRAEKADARMNAALDKIAFLEKLLADGLITKEEFDTRSSRIYVDGDGSKYSNSMESERKVSISKYGFVVAFLPAAISAVLSAVAVIILTVVL